MRVFLSADMEGTCGISAWSETEREHPEDYSYFQRQMTREVAAACRGALAAGAAEVFVRDAHDSARNIDPSELPRGTRLMRGWSGDPLSMMSGLDRGGFDAVLMTGYHAGAASPGNPLSHTMSRGSERVFLNGAPLSEFVLNAYTAGYYGVPVPFLSGDQALCAGAGGIVPGITALAVNEGLGGAVISLHPDDAVQAIYDAVKRALESPGRCLVPLPRQFQTSVRFSSHADAYSMQFYPGAALQRDKDVCFQTEDWYEMLRFYHFVFHD